MNLIVKRRFPSNKEFNELFSSVGWGTRDKKKINNHRKTSVFSLCIYNDKKTVGMLRVVGDGAYYTIYDVIARGDYQGMGIGKVLMQGVVNWYESIKDDDTYLYLGASYGKEAFYKKFGFKERPYGHVGAGMKYDPD